MPRLPLGILSRPQSIMNESEYNLKTDGYAGSVAPPVEGAYNQVAYQSVLRVNKILNQLSEEFFVLNWDPQISS